MDHLKFSGKGEYTFANGSKVSGQFQESRYVPVHWTRRNVAVESCAQECRFQEGRLGRSYL